MPVAARRTSGRSGGSFPLRPRTRVRVQSPGGAGQIHLTSTFVVAVAGASVLGGLLAVTSPGKVITAAVLHFLLFYGGVFALILMTATVGLGLVATDRIIMSPGHRITAQAVHRALSLGTLAFLVIHILLEILAARSQVIDAVVPFLAHTRAFYIGTGTIASDLILVIVVSGFMRPRFISSSRPWLWRFLHVSAYLAWIFSIIHGLLGGRTAKPYVDWSYGGLVGAVGLALTVRLVADRRGKQEVVLAAIGPGAELSGGWQQPWPAALTQAGPPAGLLSLPAGTSGLPAGAPGLPAPRLGLPEGPSHPPSDATVPQRAARSPWDDVHLPARREEPFPGRPGWDSLRAPALPGQPVPVQPSWDGIRPPASAPPGAAEPRWEAFHPPRRARHAAPESCPAPVVLPGPAGPRHDEEDDYPTGPLPRRIPRDIRSYDWPPR